MAIAVRFCAGASYLDLQDIHGVSRTACYACFHQVVDAIVKCRSQIGAMKFPEHRKSFRSSPQNSRQAHSFVRTASSNTSNICFPLHSYTRARRAGGPRIGTACFAHQHYSDWQSYFVRVVGNRFYFCPFRLDFPTTRTKCGGCYCRVFLGCNARPSYRIVETSRAHVAHPLDRSAGDAPTPRGTTVPREHKC